MGEGQTGRPGPTVDRFLTEVANRLVASHDVHRDACLGGTPLAFLAEYRRRDEKYLLTRSVRIWSVENRELLLVAAPVKSVTLDCLRRFGEDLRGSVPRLIEGHPEHMATVLLEALVTDRPVVDAVAREAVHYRKLKFLRYGLHGWVEIYLAVADIGGNRVHVHPKGLSFVRVFRLGPRREESVKR